MLNNDVTALSQMTVNRSHCCTYKTQIVANR